MNGPANSAAEIAAACGGNVSSDSVQKNIDHHLEAVRRSELRNTNGHPSQTEEKGEQ